MPGILRRTVSRHRLGDDGRFQQAPDWARIRLSRMRTHSRETSFHRRLRVIPGACTLRANYKVSRCVGCAVVTVCGSTLGSDGFGSVRCRGGDLAPHRVMFGGDCVGEGGIGGLGFVNREDV